MDFSSEDKPCKGETPYKHNTVHILAQESVPRREPIQPPKIDATDIRKMKARDVGKWMAAITGDPGVRSQALFCFRCKQSKKTVEWEPFFSVA